MADLGKTFGRKYPDAPRFLSRLAKLEATRRRIVKGAPKQQAEALANELRKLKSEALLSNPLLGFAKLIVLKRRRGQLGLPVNHKCNSGIKQTGYDNEIAVLSPVRPSGGLATLFRPAGGRFVGT